MRNTKLFYGSSYDRGLEHLLKMWPEIKEAVPEATLDICYGWNTFLATFKNNPERMAWHDKINQAMDQKGIKHHGRVGQIELQKIRRACGIWGYTTHFEEINCITALECQADGVVPVVINLAALDETVGSGIKVEGDIFLKETRETYLKELVSLMKDPDRWQVESEKAQNFARNYSWDLIANEWTNVFNS